ncbi:glycosyltransferase family 4 protein [uncultured Parabacteroides sp.]|uniref:glycosyltransferase family 4 protein n=1 Tax=uncultured Parabacteroides sp. TaxID=512312 RepID=UPI00262EF4B4|nr:glycosyltransferase family 4 protein [uncultured Parabacteroides sp.]
MKRKILVIHNGYPLCGDGGDKVRTLNMLQSLDSIGFDVFLLAFFKKDFSLVIVNKKNIPLSIKSYFIFTLPDRLGLGGIAAWLRAVITWIIVKFNHIKLVQLETSLSVSCVRFLKKDISVVTDFHADPVPELQMNGRRKSLINRAEKDVCYALSRSQRIIAVSNNLANNLKKYYSYDCPFFILPCSFNNEKFQIDPAQTITLREKMHLKERIVLCYLGGLQKWQCMEETLDLFLRLKAKDNRYFLCIYTNDDLTPFAKKIELLGNDYLCMSLRYEQVPLYLSIIDAGFVLRHNSLVNINASPTKIAEYMAVGAMVIATKYSGDAQVLIENSGYGVILDDLENISSEMVDELDMKIHSYKENKITASATIKDYILKNRLWHANEIKLKSLYSNI